MRDSVRISGTRRGRGVAASAPSTANRKGGGGKKEEEKKNTPLGVAINVPPLSRRLQAEILCGV